MQLKAKKAELEEIANRIKNCRACELWKKRTKAVPGEGNPNAKIMLVGLGPGFNEDKQGRPFVGRAGKFLDQLLARVGIRREEIFITNVVKCFLPENKATQEQVETCTKLFLSKQLKLIDPEIIVCLGEVSSRWFFQKFGLSFSSMQKLHGKIFEKQGKQIVCMLHPATMLYNPRMRKVMEQDWENLKENIFRAKIS